MQLSFQKHHIRFRYIILQYMTSIIGTLFKIIDFLFIFYICIT